MANRLQKVQVETGKDVYVEGRDQREIAYLKAENSRLRELLQERGRKIPHVRKVRHRDSQHTLGYIIA